MNAQVNPRRLRHRRGNSIIETALVMFFVLIPLSFGAIEWGYVMYVKNTTQAAAREAARKAILPTTATTAEVETAGRRVLAAAFDGPGKTLSTQFTFTITPTPNSASGTEITVRVTAPQWHQFGVRPLGMAPLYNNAAPAANRQFFATAVMYKE